MIGNLVEHFEDEHPDYCQLDVKHHHETESKAVTFPERKNRNADLAAKEDVIKVQSNDITRVSLSYPELEIENINSVFEEEDSSEEVQGLVGNSETLDMNKQIGRAHV